MTKLKPLSGKVKESVLKYLMQNLVLRSFLENGFEGTLSSKRIFWVFEKGIFQFLSNFWLTNLKPFSEKLRQSVQNYLHQNLIRGRFLENGFEATLSSKTNVLSVWKGHFSVLWKFLSDEIESIFWKSEAMLQNLFPKSLLCWELFRKCF